MDDEPFLVPIILSQNSNILLEACTNANSTALVSWTTNVGSTSIAMGCDNGSVFIFTPEPPSATELDFRLQESSPPRLQRSGSSKLAILTRLPGPPSPAPSSTSSSYFRNTNGTNHVPFAPMRSRVQAGISKEQVEAPKNYVDFDEETAKLKGILQRAPPKDRSFVEGLLPRFADHSRPQSAHERQNSKNIDEESMKSAISTTAASPILTPSSSSPPLSPTGTASLHQSIDSLSPYSLKLALHVFPTYFGQGRSVAEMKSCENGDLLAVLQECGAVTIYSTADGNCVGSIHITETIAMKPPNGCASVETDIKSIWKWRRLILGAIGETSILVALASDSTTRWTTPSQNTRVTVISMRNSSERQFGTPSETLHKIGDWIVWGSVESVGIVLDSSANPYLYLYSPSKLSLFRIRILDRVKANIAPPSNHSAVNLVLPTIPNPFKPKRLVISRPMSPYGLRRDEEGLIDLGNELMLGDLGYPAEHIVSVWIERFGPDEPILAWNSGTVKVFHIKNEQAVLSIALDIEDILSARLLSPDTIAVETLNEYQLHRLPSEKEKPAEKFQAITIAPSTRTTVGSSIYFTRITSRGHRKIEYVKVEAKASKRQIWKSPASKEEKPYRITSILPLDHLSLIIGCSDGFIRRSSVPNEIFKEEATEISDLKIDGEIISLYLIENDYWGDRYIVGGSDNGAIVIWNYNSLKLLARWIVFSGTLANVMILTEENVGKLKGCAICADQYGTLAMLSTENLEILFVVPGANARLDKICFGEDNLMIFYVNNIARLWDVKTLEIWRSMPSDKAEELVGQAGWLLLYLSPKTRSFTSSPLAISTERTFSSIDSASCVLVDLRQVLHRVSLDYISPIDQKELIVKSFLSIFLTRGLDDSIDNIIKERLGIIKSRSEFGFTCHSGAVSLGCEDDATSAWSISKEVSTWRLLSICSLLRSCLTWEGCERDINNVLLYYIASLPETLGAKFKAPTLDILVRFWFDSSAEIRLSARSLFDAALGQMSDEDVTKMVENQQHRLPCLQPDIHKESAWAVEALSLTGNIAIGRYAVLSPNTITDIAKSIAMYLHDENSAHRTLAVDLSARGFQVWQHYVDTMEILRSLFELATTTRKEGDVVSIRSSTKQAKAAILQIATSNTAQFMTKLLLDIIHPSTPEHSRSILQLLALLIRKKPLVLYPNLPRLMEAVIKSMDPNGPFRETIHDATTQILGQVVKTYPSIDFHSASQRLAVGTNEGAVVLYDLGTATRLYVLEGHKKRLSACSFSPDGRRLVTLSLEESVVMVWKVGSSFTSLFYPGAPPRQGHSGSEPFKNFSFNVGSEAYMTVAATLEWIELDWPSERTARLRIRDSTLTFNTN